MVREKEDEMYTGLYWMKLTMLVNIIGEVWITTYAFWKLSWKFGLIQIPIVISTIVLAYIFYKYFTTMADKDSTESDRARLFRHISCGWTIQLVCIMWVYVGTYLVMIHTIGNVGNEF